MMISFGESQIGVDWKAGRIRTLSRRGRQLLTLEQPPLFEMRLRTQDGTPVVLTSSDAAVSELEQGAEYSFSVGVTVVISCQARGEQLVWQASWRVPDGLTAEYIDLANVTLQCRLKENGGDSAVLWPYNEGAIIEDERMKREMNPPEYPSAGSYAMFPYMHCAQFMALLFPDGGLYLGAHDEKRGPKGLDFLCGEDGVRFRIRLFVGGEDATPEVVMCFFEGGWTAAADIYRQWFEAHRPEGLKPLHDHRALPAWYREMPIVITYPVRGIHDMDEMNPNRFFPYANALPVIDEMAEKMHSRILVLLMHWEGTAPWAPPYVWPPYGGEEMLRGFMEELHRRGHLLGVYCSGLGWTEQSNLIPSYNTAQRFEEEHLAQAMCLAPDGSLPKSRICTYQRSGYDLCPASEKGGAIFAQALEPLFRFGPDYVQAMDQNHGGSMYFCYSRHHGHPAAPGPWMTRTMQEVSAAWQRDYPNTLVGCESAAAEPYINTMLLSDNRYPLNFMTGRAVPLYSYLYHSYLHNFMGNQVCAPFAYQTEGILYRLAYSFAAGDMLTLVLNDEGEIMFHWGMRDFSRHSDREKIMAFCQRLHAVQRGEEDCFCDGRMLPPPEVESACVTLEMTGAVKTLRVPAVLTCAWETPQGRVKRFAVNWTDQPQRIVFGGKTLEAAPLDCCVLSDSMHNPA